MGSHAPCGSCVAAARHFVAVSQARLNCAPLRWRQFQKPLARHSFALKNICDDCSPQICGRHTS